MSETSLGSITLSFPKASQEDKDAGLLTQARTHIDTDLNVPMWNRNSKTHHKHAAGHTHSYRSLYIKDLPGRHQRLLGQDASMLTEANSRGARFPQKATSCLLFLPPPHPWKAGPGLSPTTGNSAVPKEEIVMKCQSVSCRLSCPLVSNFRSASLNRCLHNTEVCCSCWETIPASQTPPWNKY